MAGKGRGPEKGVKWGKMRQNWPLPTTVEFMPGTEPIYSDPITKEHIRLRYVGIIKIQGKDFYEFENLTNPKVEICLSADEIHDLYFTCA